MNTHEDNNNAHDNDDALRWQLRALRRDHVPATDLWPGIAARIARTPQGSDAPPVATPARRRTPATRFAPWALAASMVLVVGVAWQQRPDFSAPRADAGTPRLLHREADAMTREYDAALREYAAMGVPATPETTDALRQLDRSAVQIRAALQQDPNARFLLDRLRNTYEKRLALTQRGMTA